KGELGRRSLPYQLKIGLGVVVGVNIDLHRASASLLRPVRQPGTKNQKTKLSTAYCLLPTFSLKLLKAYVAYDEAISVEHRSALAGVDPPLDLAEPVLSWQCCSQTSNCLPVASPGGPPAPATAPMEWPLAPIAAGTRAAVHRTPQENSCGDCC